MKDVLSVITFVMGALCFAVFLITLKPDALSAVMAPRQSGHRKMPASLAPGCRSEPEWLEKLRPSFPTEAC
jgi:hypothetical protein